jgi:Tfp pilus assembly protein PilF
MQTSLERTVEGCIKDALVYLERGDTRQAQERLRNARMFIEIERHKADAYTELVQKLYGFPRPMGVRP